ncbi:hypothetical protein FZEAL_5275 [Fusarium zealandicum]|uniref:NADH:ubiquinone oxidoreductase intermediate-associated protein 30 domain-containing protein n=1 Tax=Fusarium zealandicum TaxID=1053134 RepID=A0A8H4UK12_9HYPO|nr:hypothetical protein FZEAL_5275 [Fusarium zealandicum]
MNSQMTYLFGGDKPWNASQWIASDDRVRGGSSVSNLTVPSPDHAIFHGTLDTKTLGGAGFASQRTVDDLSLNLNGTTGLELCLGAGGSHHKFTLTVKDTIPESGPDGGDQAGLSWEVNFGSPPRGGVVARRWDQFHAMYRGREVEDAKPLDLTDVKRVSLMARRRVPPPPMQRELRRGIMSLTCV